MKIRKFFLLPGLIMWAVTSCETAGMSLSMTSHLITTNSVWKYLDDGSDQGTAWRNTVFDDTLWSTGAAQLGYGGNGETTVVGFGPDPNNKYVTTYYRHAFAVPNAANVVDLNLRTSR